MLVRLILNDLQVYRKIVLLQIIFPGLLWASFFFYRFYGVRGYIMGSLGLLLPPIVAPLFYDIKYQSLRLSCSLPVSRTCVIAAKYLSTMMFLGITLVCYYTNAFVLSLIYGGYPTLFQQVSQFKVLLSVLYFVVVTGSFFIPAVFRTGIMGFIVTFCCGFVLAMATTMKFFQLNRDDFMHYFTPSDYDIVILTVLASLALLVLSVASSLWLFKVRDL